MEQPNLNQRQDNKEVIGKIHFLDDTGEVIETTEYTSKESYLSALRHEMDTAIDGFQRETVSREPGLLKEVDDLIYDIMGGENPKSYEDYIKIESNKEQWTNFKEQPNRETTKNDLQITPLEAQLLKAIVINEFQPGGNPANQPIWALDETDVNMGTGQLAGVTTSALKKGFIVVDAQHTKEATMAITEIGMQALKGFENQQKEDNSLTQNNTTMEPQENTQMGNAQNNEPAESKTTLDYLNNQIKYLGFTTTELQQKQLATQVASQEKTFELGLTSDKSTFGNTMDYTLNFKRSDEGRIFLNSFSGLLTTKSGEERSHTFAVKKNATVTAKQALNLLEGRAVKTNLLHKETGELEPVFLKLKLKEPKTEYGNYKIDVYNQNYGIDTAAILDKSPLTFQSQEDREKTLKSLERGNIVKAHFTIEGKSVEGKAVLNPQYKSINLYDSHMNRINTHKAIQNNSTSNGPSNQKKQHNQQRSI